MAKIAGIGIAHSGTNLIKNLLIDAFRGDAAVSFYHFGHPGLTRDGHGTITGFTRPFRQITNIRPNLLTFNYRNEFDRALSGKIRGALKEPKGKIDWLRGRGIVLGERTLDGYEERIANITTEALNNVATMQELSVRYQQVLEFKEALIGKCRQIKTKPIILPYEKFYENFDHIFKQLRWENVPISKDKIDSLKKRYSANSVYKKCKTGGSKDGMVFLANHVSTSKGEPYFWTRYVDFPEVWKSMSKENQKAFIFITKNHPHPNRPEV